MFGFKKEEQKAKRTMETKASATPYPSVGRFADNMCYDQYRNSLKCLESNSDKSKCQEQFDLYKECKKREYQCQLSCPVAVGHIIATKGEERFRNPIIHAKDLLPIGRLLFNEAVLIAK